MGIDFSHCGAHWAYSGFNKFRERLAEKIGFDLRKMAGFDGDQSWDTMNDDIKPLLNHSDCDGFLSPEVCKFVYPRLLQLISDWDDNDYDKQMGVELAKGMKTATERNEDFEFQ